MKTPKETIHHETEDTVIFKAQSMKVKLTENGENNIELVLREIVAHAANLLHVDSVQSTPSLESLAKSMPNAKAFCANIIDDHRKIDKKIDLKDLSISTCQLNLTGGAVELGVELKEEVGNKIHWRRYTIKIRTDSLLFMNQVQKTMAEEKVSLEEAIKIVTFGKQKGQN